MSHSCGWAPSGCRLGHVVTAVMTLTSARASLQDLAGRQERPRQLAGAARAGVLRACAMRMMKAPNFAHFAGLMGGRTCGGLLRAALVTLMSKQPRLTWLGGRASAATCGGCLGWSRWRARSSWTAAAARPRSNAWPGRWPSSTRLCRRAHACRHPLVSPACGEELPARGVVLVAVWHCEVLLLFCQSPERVRWRYMGFGVWAVAWSMSSKLPYAFDDSDARISLQQLRSFVDAHDEVRAPPLL